MRARGVGVGERHPGPTAAWAPSPISGGGWGVSGAGPDEVVASAPFWAVGQWHPFRLPGALGLRTPVLGTEGNAERAGSVGHRGTVGFGLGGVGVLFPNSCVGWVGGGGLFPLDY